MFCQPHAILVGWHPWAHAAQLRAKQSSSLGKRATHRQIAMETLLRRAAGVRTLWRLCPPELRRCKVQLWRLLRMTRAKWSCRTSLCQAWASAWESAANRSSMESCRTIMASRRHRQPRCSASSQLAVRSRRRDYQGAIRPFRSAVSLGVCRKQSSSTLPTRSSAGLSLGALASAGCPAEGLLLPMTYAKRRSRPSSSSFMLPTTSRMGHRTMVSGWERRGTATACRSGQMGHATRVTGLMMRHLGMEPCERCREARSTMFNKHAGRSR
mmetsp:Transcript_65343/g.156213  ORF Transcript_65343/g.156213 Transcript_65343/m.156213 type:complete len:269 (+) Transcript_65343:34-840(+)